MNNLIWQGLAPSTVMGTASADTLDGTSGDDLIKGLGGNDYLRGHAGNDTLDGGAGYDTAFIDFAGQSTPVQIDLSHWTSGEKLKIANVDGGHDTLIGIEQIDVRGTSGNDTFTGSDGSDDYLTAGGKDSVKLGGGRDAVNIYGDDATVLGGGGDDSIYVWDFNGYNTGTVRGGGGSGFDRLVADWDNDFSDVTLKVHNGHVVGASADGHLGVDLTGIESVDFYCYGAIRFQGGAAADFVYGGQNASGGSMMRGAGGDDILVGGAGNDTLLGGEGDDTIRGGGGQNTLAGGHGYDLYGFEAYQVSSDFTHRIYDASGFDIRGAHQSVGQDAISGFEAVEILGADDSNDSVIGSGGNDELADGGGTDTLLGGAGDDLVRKSSFYPSDSSLADADNHYEGGTGTDTLSYQYAYLDNYNGPGWVLDVQAGTATGMGSSTGIDTFTGFEHIIGSGAHDTLLGSSAGETLDGGAGGDTINGRAGADVLIGGAGSDHLTGGAGADVFAFLSVADSAPGAEDRIVDLQAQDSIDLSAIDADAATAGDQAFTLVAHLDGHAGQAALSYDAGADLTTLALDVDGDGQADAEITLNGDQTGFTHFVL